MWSLAAATLMPATGCEQSDPPASAPQPPIEAPVAVPQTAWRNVNDSLQVAVADASDEEQLARATAQARATLEQARQRWQRSGEIERRKFAVKWAAETAVGGVEHLWVRPLTWSAFRIEGTLLSPPTTTLLSGKQAGDFVSFPIEDSSDWVYLHSGDPSGLRDGGFTLDVISRQFGQPPPELLPDG
jgi:uncharacterized protein YegJ (DUF2314 family)